MTTPAIREARIPVHVSKGIFSSERFVSFQVGDRAYNLLVDQVDVIDNHLLLVRIVADQGEEIIVDLPRDTFTTGNRVRLPRDLVQMS